MNKISLAMCVAATSAAMVACAAPAAQPAAKTAAQPATQPAAQPADATTTVTVPAGSNFSFSAEGGSGSFIIKNGKIAHFVHTNNLSTPVVNNDPAGTLDAANKLAVFEARAKAVDSVYNSQNLYKHAALTAAAQGNVQVVQQVIAVQPKAQVFMQQMTVTRGAKTNAPAAIPQMVEVTFGGWDKLTPAQAPIWGDYIMAFYPQMNRAAAEIFANKVNSSRSVKAPVLLAEAAVDLGKFDGDKVPAAFQAKNVFANAVDMAIFLNDKAAMEKIVALYDKASFKDAKTAKNLAAELKAMGKTRGRFEFTNVGGSGSFTVGPGGVFQMHGFSGGRTRILNLDGADARAAATLDAYSDRYTW